MWIFLYSIYCFMLEGKSLTEFIDLFSPNNFEKNDNVILNYFLISI